MTTDASPSAPSGSSAAPPLRTTKETHPNLPPGLILGADGKPCKVCNSWQDWAKMRVKKKDPSASSSSSSSSSKTASDPMAMMAAMAGGAALTKKKEAVDPRADCPADTAELGRATWTFLHTTAAYYPLRPSEAQKGQMRALLGSLPALYPCTPCADDFGEDIKTNPPDVSGREGLSRWLCERHNEVNRKLGKRVWACDWKTMDERWKEGPADGRCD